MTGDRILVIEPIATNHIDGALEDKPDRCITLSHVEDHLTGSKIPGRSTRETLRRLDLPRVEHGKQLVTTGFDDGHRRSPVAVPTLHHSTQGEVLGRVLIDRQPNADVAANRESLVATHLSF